MTNVVKLSVYWDSDSPVMSPFSDLALDETKEVRLSDGDVIRIEKREWAQGFHGDGFESMVIHIVGNISISVLAAWIFHRLTQDEESESDELENHLKIEINGENVHLDPKGIEAHLEDMEE